MVVVAIVCYGYHLLSLSLLSYHLLSWVSMFSVARSRGGESSSTVRVRVRVRVRLRWG
jgi:hypothetical protein